MICNKLIINSTLANYNSAYAVTTVQFATHVERGFDNNLMIRIVRSSGVQGLGDRNHLLFDHVYCWSGIGTARSYGMGQDRKAHV